MRSICPVFTFCKVCTMPLGQWMVSVLTVAASPRPNVGQMLDCESSDKPETTCLSCFPFPVSAIIFTPIPCRRVCSRNENQCGDEEDRADDDAVPAEAHHSDGTVSKERRQIKTVVYKIKRRDLAGRGRRVGAPEHMLLSYVHS